MQIDSTGVVWKLIERTDLNKTKKKNIDNVFSALLKGWVFEREMNTSCRVCQEMNWTVCPWLQRCTCFYFINASAERTKQCVRWTMDIHQTNKQRKRQHEQDQLSYDFLTQKCHRNFGQLRLLWNSDMMCWSQCIILGRMFAGKCVWMCTRTDRGGEHLRECLWIV